MEIIDNKSADGSSLPPLSDGRSSPAEELNNLDDDIGLIDPGDHSEQAAANIMNDLNAVTPPSSHSQSPVHTSLQENKPLQPTTSPDFISSVAPSNISITPTLNDPPEASPYEATPSGAAPLAPVTSSLTEHASNGAGELLPPAVSPATSSAPASTTTPMPNLSANFSGEPASLTLGDQGEAGLSTIDSIVDERIAPVTLSSIEHTTDDSGEHLCPPVPPATLSAPASSTPVSNPCATADDTPPPPTLNNQGEAALLAVGTSSEVQVASVSDTEHELYDVALPPTVLPTTAVHANTFTTNPLPHPSATSDTTPAPLIIADQDVAASNTVGPSVEAQPSTANPPSIGYTLDYDEKPLPPTVQPTNSIAIPGNSSPITSLPHPQATSDSSSTHPSLSDEGETVPHAVGLSAEDQFAPVTSTSTGHTVDHDNRSSPLAVLSTTSLSEIPAITSSAPPSHPLATPHSMLSGQSEKYGIETAADNEPASKTTSALNQPRVIAEDAHSSTYPPSSTVGEREAAVSSEISSSVPGPSVIPSEGAAMSTKLNNDTQEEPTDLKDNKFTLHEEPRSFKVEEGEKEAVEYEPPVISSDLQAPDRRYHSRARLDSLEDRNNLDTDSEMQLSFSESEKESDTEDYPGRRPTRKRQRRHRRSSTSISSSEDERDPFLEHRNDLSIVSSPEPELPHDGGGFGVSLSAGEGIVKKFKEHSKFSDPGSQMPPPDIPQLQKLDVSTTGNLNERSTDKYEGRNFHESAAIHVDSTPTLQIELRKVELLNEDKEQGGFQTQLGSVSPRMGARTLMLQGESSELHNTRQHKPSSSEQEMYTKEQLLKSEVAGEPYQSLSDPGLSSQYVYSGLMPNSEEEPMRTEPTHQVTRTSDPVLESTSSSSDQMQLPVRKSFSSHPPSIAPSLDRVNHLPKLPPVSLSAPSTGIHSMLDQPPPPFTHYAAPPPIFRAHVLEQQPDPVYSISMVEDMDVRDTAGQDSHEERETAMDVEEKDASAETGMEGHTEQTLMQNSLNSHRPFSGGPTSSTSHLVHAPSMVCMYLYWIQTLALFSMYPIKPLLMLISIHVVIMLTEHSLLSIQVDEVNNTTAVVTRVDTLLVVITLWLW